MIAVGLPAIDSFPLSKQACHEILTFNTFSRVKRFIKVVNNSHIADGIRNCAVKWDSWKKKSYIRTIFITEIWPRVLQPSRLMDTFRYGVARNVCFDLVDVDQTVSRINTGWIQMELTNFFPAHTEDFMPIRVPNRILRIGSPIFQSEDFGPTWWVGGEGRGHVTKVPS